MKKIIAFAFFAVLFSAPAYALTISAYSLSNTTINAETVGTQTNTTVQFTLDGGPSNVVVSIFRVVNGGDPLGTLVHTINVAGLNAGANTILWNGLWLINGELGRIDGNYRFQIEASSTGATATPVSIGTLASITSTDIHGITILSSRDANQNAAPPYTISYFLAKDSLVTARIRNPSGTVVRTLINNQPRSGENFDVLLTSNTAIWDGLGDDGHPVPNGIYTLNLDATDPSNSDHAISRTRTLGLESVASAGADAQKLFDDNTFVYPNPIRSGSATIQMQAVRANASLTLKIYTIAGDLVRDEHFDNVAPGNIISFNWDVTNQSGSKLGRGLYFYVVREKDSEGTLQTIKKMAVIK